ncbi:MAG: hypothetical protein RPU52_06675 [Candidatus Sedimenticola sp. (ex Thyasira tokunagai)]
MNDNEKSRSFVLGNVLLGVALILLLNIGALWEMLGAASMGLWIALAAAGAYFLMSGKDDSPKSP